VDRRDVRVIERREQLRLALEACETIGIQRESRRQDFQRDVSIELRIARSVDFAL